MCATRNPFPPLMSTLERVTAALFAVCSVRSANEEGESRPGIRWQDLHCPVATKATHVHQVKSHKTPERGCSPIYHFESGCASQTRMQPAHPVVVVLCPGPLPNFQPDSFKWCFFFGFSVGVAAALMPCKLYCLIAFFVGRPPFAISLSISIILIMPRGNLFASWL